MSPMSTGRAAAATAVPLTLMMVPQAAPRLRCLLTTMTSTAGAVLVRTPTCGCWRRSRTARRRRRTMMAGVVTSTPARRQTRLRLRRPHACRAPAQAAASRTRQQLRRRGRLGGGPTRRAQLRALCPTRCRRGRLAAAARRPWRWCRGCATQLCRPRRRAAATARTIDLPSRRRLGGRPRLHAAIAAAAAVWPPLATTRSPSTRVCRRTAAAGAAVVDARHQRSLRRPAEAVPAGRRCHTSRCQHRSSTHRAPCQWRRRLPVSSARRCRWLCGWRAPRLVRARRRRGSSCCCCRRRWPRQQHTPTPPSLRPCRRRPPLVPTASRCGR